MPRAFSLIANPARNDLWPDDFYWTFRPTLSVLESLPEAAVTRILKLPACVPLTGGCTTALLHAGSSTSENNIHPSSVMPMIRRRRWPLNPRLTTARPGNASQVARKNRLKKIVVGITIGRTVVVMFMVMVAPLVLCNATELCGLKLHCVPVSP